MAEMYLRWSDIKDALIQSGKNLSENELAGMAVALSALENLSAADVEPVVHGRWVQVICHEEFEDGFVDRVKECCSVCHTPNGRRMSNYCPNCGARMDGK